MFHWLYNFLKLKLLVSWHWNIMLASGVKHTDSNVYTPFVYTP